LTIDTETPPIFPAPARGEAQKARTGVHREGCLTVPSRRKRFSLPWSIFPPSLEADVETYLRRAELDPKDKHFIRVQRPATIETRRWQLRFFATAIAKSGVPADTLVDLRAILEPQIAAHGLQFLLDRNDGALSVEVSNIAVFLGTLAGRLEMSNDVIYRLRRMARKLRVDPSGFSQHEVGGNSRQRIDVPRLTHRLVAHQFSTS
jgi:hypothetical protein